MVLSLEVSPALAKDPLMISDIVVTVAVAYNGESMIFEMSARQGEM